MSFRINIPPVTRVVLLLLIGTSLVYQAASYRNKTVPTKASPAPWITLTPQLSIFYPWVYVTCSLAEKNVLTLLVAGATILYGGKYLERAWGSAEYGKFLLVATLIPNVVAAFLGVLAFAITRTDAQVANTIQGSISIQAAFLVAFKQLVPEHTVTILKGFVKIRVKHFLAIFLTANTISGVVFSTYSVVGLSWLGFITSWTYLRFYKRQPDFSGSSTGGSILRGDASETFAFAYFWPDAVHGPIASISDGTFDVLVAMKVCTPFSAEEIESSNMQANARGEGGLPSLMNVAGGRGGGGKREEAERRRALALKALNQRLQAASSNRQQHNSPTSAAGTDTTSPPTDQGNGERSKAAQESTQP